MQIARLPPLLVWDGTWEKKRGLWHVDVVSCCESVGSGMLC
jgi:hypothetical protein